MTRHTTASRAWFLDLDGTLVDIADTPHAVRRPDGLPRLLRELARRSGGALAVISGRPLRELDALLGTGRLPAAGLHGLERRTAGGAVIRARPDPGRHRPVWGWLQSQLDRHPGLLGEAKGMSFAIHYRRAPRLAGYAHRLANQALERLGPAYHRQPGKRVVELRPAGADKGDAIRAFLAEPPFRGRVPVFIGDDRTDEAGFAAVEAAGGMSIKVGPGPSRARWRLADAGAVRGWLRDGHPAPTPNRGHRRRRT
ncbi:MAG TPA: trehalose-phosphatase [Gemmatimonadales bacterium]|nr:trehalose-phosphatase [Gemmatimonadales bacterium]